MLFAPGASQHQSHDMRSIAGRWLCLNGSLSIWLVMPAWAIVEDHPPNPGQFARRGRHGTELRGDDGGLTTSCAAPPETPNAPRRSVDETVDRWAFTNGPTRHVTTTRAGRGMPHAQPRQPLPSTRRTRDEPVKPRQTQTSVAKNRSSTGLARVSFLRIDPSGRWNCG